MKSILKKRARAAAVVGVFAGALTLGLAGSASASSVPAWRLQVCNWGDYQANVYLTNGGYLALTQNQCSTIGYTPMSSTLVVHVGIWESNGTYIASADVNVTEGAGIATGGTSATPYMWSF